MARNIPFPVHLFGQFFAQLNIPSFAQMSHIFRVFFQFCFQQFNAFFDPTLRFYLSYYDRVQFIIYFNRSIAFIIPVLTTFVQLKYLGTDENKSPFATHPTTMHISVCSSVLYYLVHIALMRFPLRHRFAVAAFHCLVSSGYASVASLTSVLLPNSFSGILYAVFVLLLASELLCEVFTEDNDAEFVLRRRYPHFLNNRQWPRILPIRM